MQPKKLTREEKIRAAVVALIVGILLVCILKNESQFYQLYTTPTPPKGQQLVWSTKIVFEDYDPVKGQAEFRAAQARHDRQIALEEKASAHRARIKSWIKWLVVATFATFLVIWELRLRRAQRPPSLAAQTPVYAGPIRLNLLPPMSRWERFRRRRH